MLVSLPQPAFLLISEMACRLHDPCKLPPCHVTSHICHCTHSHDHQLSGIVKLPMHQVACVQTGLVGCCDSPSFRTTSWEPLDLEANAPTAAARWQSDDQGGHLVISTVTTVWSNHHLILWSRQKISVSATVSLCAKKDWIALRVHAVSAEAIDSGKVTVAGLACRASPSWFDPANPARYGALLHVSFSSVDDSQLEGAEQRATGPILIASEGLTLKASFGSGAQGPSFQAAAWARATGINESSQRSLHGLLAAFCQRSTSRPDAKVQWVLRFTVDVRWSSSRTTSHLLMLKPFSFCER